MPSSEENKLFAIQELVGKIRDLKAEIDEKFLKKNEVEKQLTSFIARYETYLHELQGQRRSLENQIYQIRNQMANFFSSNTEESEALIDEDGGNVDLVDEWSTQEGTYGNVQSDHPPDIADQKKKNILHHFARFWHPDYSLHKPKAQGELMTELNVIFNNSRDPADMLAAIPWDPAWSELVTGETLGSRWERLMEWYSYLQIASQRIDDDILVLEQNPFYSSLGECKKYRNEIEYFSYLANKERNKIDSLEETLDMLLIQWRQLKNEAKE